MSEDDNDQDKKGLGQFGDKAGGGGVADFEYQQARKNWREILGLGIRYGQIIADMDEPLRDHSEKEVQALVDLINESSIFSAGLDQPVTKEDLFELDDALKEAKENVRQALLEKQHREVNAQVEGALDLHEMWNSCYNYSEQRVNEIMLHTLMQEKGYGQKQILDFKTRMLELEKGRYEFDQAPKPKGGEPEGPEGGQPS